MEAKLIVVQGKASRGEIRLKLPTSIGRRKDCGLVIVHKSVSRQHCEVYERNGKLFVRDNHSSNGTFVNERLISESPLLPGDRLRVGPLTFRAEYQLRPEPAPPVRNPSLTKLIRQPDDLPYVGDLGQEEDSSAFGFLPREGHALDDGDRQPTTNALEDDRPDEDDFDEGYTQQQGGGIPKGLRDLYRMHRDGGSDLALAGGSSLNSSPPPKPPGSSLLGKIPPAGVAQNVPTLPLPPGYGDLAGGDSQYPAPPSASSILPPPSIHATPPGMLPGGEAPSGSGGASSAERPVIASLEMGRQQPNAEESHDTAELLKIFQTGKGPEDSGSSPPPAPDFSPLDKLADQMGLDLGTDEFLLDMGDVFSATPDVLSKSHSHAKRPPAEPEAEATLHDVHQAANGLMGDDPAERRPFGGLPQFESDNEKPSAK